MGTSVYTGGAVRVKWAESSTWQGLLQQQKWLCFCFNSHVYFWPCWIFPATLWLSPVAARWGYSWLGCTGLLQSTGSRRSRFTRCVWLWRVGLVAPQHMESSWARDQTHVPCNGTQSLLTTGPLGKPRGSISIMTWGILRAGGEGKSVWEDLN